MLAISIHPYYQQKTQLIYGKDAGGLASSAAFHGKYMNWLPLGVILLIKFS